MQTSDRPRASLRPHEGDPLTTTGKTAAETCPPWCRSHRAHAGEDDQQSAAHRSDAETWSDRPEHYVQLVRQDTAERVGRAEIHIRAGQDTFVLADVTSSDVGALAVAMLCLRADSLSPACGTGEPGATEQSA